ncbi:hypothetical protein G6O67_003141 [Ophiocordyceps sinensis]|uniref:Uncharacterized protein n=1 Tax=Ophiocordyceps sinensis TaxID=72228 RepID=A0A8H4PW45_9HYPO|nr:hypothetical protein G6O67_003141 [Ophiocordyceps sinensis]
MKKEKIKREKGAGATTVVIIHVPPLSRHQRLLPDARRFLTLLLALLLLVLATGSTAGSVSMAAAITASSTSAPRPRSSSSSRSVRSSLNMRTASLPAAQCSLMMDVPTGFIVLRYQRMPPSDRESPGSLPKLPLDWGGVGGPGCSGRSNAGNPWLAGGVSDKSTPLLAEPLLLLRGETSIASEAPCSTMPSPDVLTSMLPPSSPSPSSPSTSSAVSMASASAAAVLVLPNALLTVISDELGASTMIVSSSSSPSRFDSPPADARAASMLASTNVSNSFCSVSYGLFAISDSTRSAVSRYGCTALRIRFPSFRRSRISVKTFRGGAASAASKRRCSATSSTLGAVAMPSPIMSPRSWANESAVT